MDTEWVHQEGFVYLILIFFFVQLWSIQIKRITGINDFKVKLGDQDTSCASHIACKMYGTLVTVDQWIRNRCMKFGMPVVWSEPNKPH